MLTGKERNMLFLLIFFFLISLFNRSLFQLPWLLDILDQIIYNND